MNINRFRSPVGIYLKFYAVESTLGPNPALKDSAILWEEKIGIFIAGVVVLCGPAQGSLSASCSS